MRADFSVRGLAAFDHRIDRIVGRTLDPRPAFNAIVDDILDMEREQFSTQGARSHKWAALKTSTRRAKARAGYPARINVRTGDTRRAATRRGAPHQKIEVRRDGLAVKVTTKGGVFADRWSRRQKRRSVFDETRGDRKAWAAQIRRYIVTGELR